MNTKENWKEIAAIILATVVLGLTVAYKNHDLFYAATISFLIIIVVNTLIKKLAGHYLETGARTKLWSWYHFGFRKDWHFKSPIPMIWLPLLLVLFTKGFFLWLGVLEFDVEAKTERVSRKHGLYRFTEVTEWHIAWIIAWSLLANFVLAITAYIAGFELFAKLSIYFITWSLIPIAGFDGSKMLYASKPFWIISFTIAILTLIWGLTII
jgi:hypothetical protein